MASAFGIQFDLTSASPRAKWSIFGFGRGITGNTPVGSVLAGSMTISNSRDTKVPRSAIDVLRSRVTSGGLRITDLIEQIGNDPVIGH